MSRSLTDQLREYAAMPDNEIRSRKNAIPEIKALLRRAIDALAPIPRGDPIMPELAERPQGEAAARALADAARNNQAKPLISRQEGEAE